MNQSLLHRGPDSDGFFADEIVGIAARRLAIIDLVGGDQPIANEDGSVVVVQNGEIYNYRELSRELLERGHRFRTRSDTEVLVHLYEDRGPRFVDALRGMFAIAVWDGRKRRLVLARDRFGIKPLYYRLAGDSLSFASELKALVRQPGFSREIDPSGLEAFLAFGCIPAPLTIFREVRKLPAGSVLISDPAKGQHGTRIEQYATPLPAQDGEVRSDDEDELAEELQMRLRDSIRAHLVADVPVGVLLSGGIDSSTLTALTALESPQKVSTFSIGFEERLFDEREAARTVAERYETDHHELVLRPDAAELLPLLADVFDEPFADSSAIPTYLVSKLARGKVKVALSGEGGDELFGGYNYYVGHRLAPRLAPVASIVRPLVERLPTSDRKASTFEHKAKRFVRGASLPPIERHYAWKSIFSPSQRAEILRPEVRGSLDPFDLMRVSYADSQGADELARIMNVDLRLFLVEDMLVKTDRASMAHSLEARVPFLDPVVAELALALPSRYKVRGFDKKTLLRRAMSSLLPAATLNGEKRGFSIPIAAWLRGELEAFAREVLSPSAIRRQGFFNSEAVTGLLDAHVFRRADFSRQLWSLLAFSLWHDRYGAAAPQ